MTFDVRRYEDDVLKPLRRPGSDLDDLPVLYALREPGSGPRIPADPEILAVRIRQVRELWRQRSAGVRATDRICRELLRRDELLRAGTGPRLEDPASWYNDRWKTFLHHEPPRPASVPVLRGRTVPSARPGTGDGAPEHFEATGRLGGTEPPEATEPAAATEPVDALPVVPAAQISLPARLLPLAVPPETVPVEDDQVAGRRGRAEAPEPPAPARTEPVPESFAEPFAEPVPESFGEPFDEPFDESFDELPGEPARGAPGDTAGEPLEDPAPSVEPMDLP
ncbi:MAG: hypothetical protein QG608_1690, partial [Actinomycetota bacterium]|nr:hypothetical protein [Actinomycetota bacterium]